MCSCSLGYRAPRACSTSLRFPGTDVQLGAHAPAAAPQVVKLDHDFGTKFSGVLTDAGGRLRALWGSYSEQVCRARTCLRPLPPATLRCIGLQCLKPRVCTPVLQRC